MNLSFIDDAYFNFTRNSHIKYPIDIIMGDYCSNADNYRKI